MFTFVELKIYESYNDPDEFMKLKIHFHIVLGKKEKDVWSLVKIVKVLPIVPDILFEGVLQIPRYTIVKANNVLFDFIISDFPLPNLNDLITVTKIFAELDKSQVQDQDQTWCIFGYAHVKSFLDCYYSYFAFTKFFYKLIFLNL